MHEVEIMRQMVTLAEERAKEDGAQHINHIHLRVGEESGVVPESLDLAFEVTKKGTIAETAQLEIETVPTLCYCATCDLEFHPTDALNECPECHQANCEVRHGTEFELAFLDVS